MSLASLIQDAESASPSERIELRDAIASFGPPALQGAVEWMRRGVLVSLGIQVVGRVALSGHWSLGVNSLEAMRDELADSYGREIDAELGRVGRALLVPPAGARIRKQSWHHSVYVVLLGLRSGFGYYVGLTGLTIGARFARHVEGVQSSTHVQKWGRRLVEPLTDHLNPMDSQTAAKAEEWVFQRMQSVGFNVYGGH